MSSKYAKKRIILILLYGISIIIVFFFCFYRFSYKRALNDASKQLGLNYRCYICYDPVSELDRFEEQIYIASGNYQPNIKYQLYRHQVMSTSDPLNIDEYQHMLDILVDTEMYIKGYDVKERERAGCDYHELDDMWHEELFYSLIDDERKILENVDRKRALVGVFYLVCGDYVTGSENYEKILAHLQKVSFHPGFNTVEQNGEMLLDPLILLDLHCMKCGQVNRLACDLWESVGGDSRVCQLGGHVVSELFYDGDYHFFDADCTIGMPFDDEKVPSLSELSTSDSIDLMDKYIEQYCVGSTNYDVSHRYSSYVLNEKTFAADGCVYYVKCAPEEESINKYYGWNYWDSISANDVILNNDEYYCPCIPYIESVFLNGEDVEIKWLVDDIDDDVAYYKVYVSETSRGWNWGSYYASDDLSEYMCDLYSVDQWPFVGTLPENAKVYTTEECRIKIKLTGGGIYL